MVDVTVVGCGAIGSQLIPHLGRLPGIDRVTLCDRQSYEPKNIASQAIDAADVGQAKSLVQAMRLRRISSSLEVEAIVGPVESLPYGSLRCSLILGALDSRLARMRLGQAAWRTGTPYIDAGVEPAGLLARVSAYLPGDDFPCYECAWSNQDYLALEATYPCNGGVASTRPTNAPSGLGALAASLQAIAAQKCLAGQPELVPFGSQVLIDAGHHKHYLTSYRRNPNCRFDHRVWTIEDFPLDYRECSLRDALNLAGAGCSGEETWLSVEGKPFVLRLVCAGCGESNRPVRLRDSLDVRDRLCARCGRSTVESGWDLAERLTSRSPREILGKSLAALGLRRGEVLTIGNAECERHFEITVAGRDRSLPVCG